MRKNPMIALLLTVVMLFGAVAPVMAALTPEQQAELDRQHYVSDRINDLRAAGQNSSDEIYSVTVDLLGIPNHTVAATVYEAVYSPANVTTYTNIGIQPITGVNGAKDKVTRFWFYIRNYNRDHVMATWGSAPENTVTGYVYGPRKLDMLNGFVAGIPECLANIRLYDSGTGDLTSADAWAEKYRTSNWMYRDSDGDDGFSSDTPNQIIQQQPSPPQITENQSASIIFTPDSQTYTVNGETQQMDVKPYLKNGLLYAPVRFLAYSLGIPDSGIQWDQINKIVTITKDEVTIILTIGSPIMLVNGQPITMDLAPEIKNNRTMLPSEWITNVLEEPGS